MSTLAFTESGNNWGSCAVRNSLIWLNKSRDGFIFHPKIKLFSAFFQAFCQFSSQFYPSRQKAHLQAVFRSMITGVAFGHDSVNSLLRELARNAQLAQLYGFNPLDSLPFVKLFVAKILQIDFLINLFNVFSFFVASWVWALKSMILQASAAYCLWWFSKAKRSASLLIRVKTPTPHHTVIWQKGCNQHTSLERIFFRFDQGSRFERHYIRGKMKMQTQVSIAMDVMMALALYWAERKHQTRLLVETWRPPKVA